MSERDDRIAKVERLLEYGVTPYATKFKQTHLAKEILAGADLAQIPTAEELIAQKGTGEYSVGGRVRMFREHGKIAFAHIQDSTSKIQICFMQDILGKDLMKQIAKTLDIGDFIGVQGDLFLTHKKEPTILVKKYTFLSKAILPLPEKWHGVQDRELIYRQRYLDLTMNEASFQRFSQISQITQEIRSYLLKYRFTEVTTPTLQTILSGAMAHPFQTHHNTLDLDLVLRIAPETFLKRCVAGGMERVFEFARCFRNEGMDPSHLQEFTMLEYYVAYWDYQENMKFTEKLLSHIVKKVTGSLVIDYQGTKIDFQTPWPRRDFAEIIKQDCGIDIYQYETKEHLEQALKKHKIDLDYDPQVSLSTLQDILYKKVSRPQILAPTFIINHPINLKPLARKNDQDPRKADTFQLLVNGWEILNAYSELIDPIDQKLRLELQASARAQGDQEAMPYDQDFITCMEHGMPPMSGWGMGIERFSALLTNQENLRDVTLFPLMRPLQDQSE